MYGAGCTCALFALELRELLELLPLADPGGVGGKFATHFSAETFGGKI
jgi:hypothetical protein